MSHSQKGVDSLLEPIRYDVVTFNDRYMFHSLFHGRLVYRYAFYASSFCSCIIYYDKPLYLCNVYTPTYTPCRNVEHALYINVHVHRTAPCTLQNIVQLGIQTCNMCSQNSWAAQSIAWTLYNHLLGVPFALSHDIFYVLRSPDIHEEVIYGRFTTACWHQSAV